MANILIIEDNAKLAHNISTSLSDNDHQTTWCASGAQTLATVSGQVFDVVLLDLGLPDCNGIELIESIRKSAPNAGIIVITARDKIEDRITGLDRGCDDYLVKPFALAELLARVRAVLRRTQLSTEVLPTEVAGITVDYRKRRITINDEVLDLPPREYDLLVYLIENRGDHVSRDMLAREVWQIESRATSLNNVIDVHVSRLRERLHPFGKDRLIKTVRGVGFTFDG